MPDASDSLPVALNRTVSAVSKSWLSDYEIIDERKLSAEELKRSRRILGRHVGATMADRRETILQTVNLPEDLSQRHWIRSIITDCLAAHEFGNEDYFGHFSLYCDPRFAFPGYLSDQEDLYIGSYLISSLGAGDAAAVQLVSRPIMNLLDTEWVAEMLALASERRRLTSHLAGSSTFPIIREILETLIEGIDLRIGNSSPSGVGLLAWAKLYEKFGERLSEIIVWLRKCLVLDPEYKIVPQIVTQYHDEYPRDIELVPHNQKYYGPSLEYTVLQLLDERVPGSLDLETIPHVSKVEMLCLTAKRSPNSTFFKEFPELKALLVGDLWLALHSLTSLQVLDRKVGSSYLYLRKNVKHVADSEALHLAIEMFRFRNRMLNAFRFSERPDKLIRSVHRSNSTIEYIAGGISFEQLDQASRHMCVTEVDGSHIGNLTTHFHVLQEGLRKYYTRNGQKIDRYLREPQDFFSRVL
jgi:hypothetical protein